MERLYLGEEGCTGLRAPVNSCCKLELRFLDGEIAVPDAQEEFRTHRQGCFVPS